MRGVHEDEVGSDYYYTVYRCGTIVQRFDNTWGVVVRAGGNKYHSRIQRILWLMHGLWVPAEYVNSDAEVSAPYSHTCATIPDEVRAKATAIILLRNA